MADSLKLAVVSAVVCVLAWSHLLDAVGGDTGSTMAFLLYFMWPGLALALSVVVAFLGVRDAKAHRRLQAIAAIALSLVVLIFSWTQFSGWE